VLATGSDTETYEAQPAPDRGTPANPQPVHTLLLIERGIYILESLDLEEIARAGLREFLFVALPLSIRGATGSMLDPVAIT
jgi:kynurenine formamidase